jgi:ATP-dependent Clp protease ATP-binding subunit ClpC
MFERFTDRARRVVVLAQEEARELGHDYIGTEHFLLGLIHEGDGVAVKVLGRLGVSPDDVRSRVLEAIGRGEHENAEHIPFTPRAKEVLELSLRESRQIGHDYIGTEHLLLGLLREGQGVAAQVLSDAGVTLDQARRQVLELLYGGEYPPMPAVATRAHLGEVLSRLDAMADRLTVIERHLGIGKPDPDAG